MNADDLVQTVANGFETLQKEYQKLHERHVALERRLETTRDQVGQAHFPFICPLMIYHLALDL